MHGHLSGCKKLYPAKAPRFLIIILTFACVYGFWALSPLRIAGALDQQEPAPLSNEPLALPTENPTTSGAASDGDDNGSKIHPNATTREDRIPRSDVRVPVGPKPGPNSGGSSVSNPDIAAEEKAELTETARLLAVLLDSGRVVVGKAQSAINNPRLEDKGLSLAVFEERLRKEFLARTGHDLRSLAPAQMPERAKVLLVRLAYFMQKSVHDAEPLINRKGIGFKGFIPATFATRVAENFSKDTGLTLRQIGPPSTAPRNPGNRPDEREQAALFVMQKSHPRVGDHIVEQQIEDRGMRVLLPLFYTKACLACHGQPKGQMDISGYEKEGFKEGDIGGAISVMVPVAAQQLKADTAR